MTKDSDKAIFKVGVIMVMGVVLMAAAMHVMQPAPLTVTPSGGIVSEGVVIATPGPDYAPCVGLAATPTVTLQTYDRYNPGTAITTQNMYRVVGTKTWTDVTGTGTIQQSAGTEIEIVFGIDSNDEVEEPPGALMLYTMPCRETYTLSVPVANDVDGTSDVTSVVFDEDGTVAAEAVSNGDVKTLKMTLTGKYEYDLGNIDCGETSNMLIAKYNSSNISKVTVTSIKKVTGDEKSYAVETVGVPAGISGSLAASKFAVKAWNFPVIESNSKYEVVYVLEADDTNDPAAADFMWYLSDSGHYLDNDDNLVKCGVEDEDQVDIGLTGQVSETSVIT